MMRAALDPAPEAKMAICCICKSTGAGGENKKDPAPLRKFPFKHETESMRKCKQQTLASLPILFNKFVDSNMTEGQNEFVQFAETHAKCGKKNFHHVDILLKS